VQIFSDSSPRVWPLGRGSYFLQNQTSICCLRPASGLEQKIEFVISCQSRNLSTGASRACALSPSRLTGKTWQATRRRNPPCWPPRFTQRRSSLFPPPENGVAYGRWPSDRPPASAPPPASRDWHCLAAFPGHRAAPVSGCSAAPSSLLRSASSADACCAVSTVACVAHGSLNFVRPRIRLLTNLQLISF